MQNSDVNKCPDIKKVTTVGLSREDSSESIQQNKKTTTMVYSHAGNDNADYFSI